MDLQLRVVIHFALNTQPISFKMFIRPITNMIPILTHTLENLMF